ncbi:contact-dependent growth inhibition system immunity protein [Paraburkholderia antibiotica]|uniref:Glycogen/starch/alpha-glucan phosphorylase n=1 Tax=Paraburkholderia antibiotica TaxID=2728839 RepID=A0A7X9X675_9BURK|nr:contact-dependent growth inhibition system immunity protein [Paraburkholderia antibiotica]NML31677.1 glycogen/starch/alpha-glucan phosphorylase [Paraburkholderia antibiotica]
MSSLERYPEMDNFFSIYFGQDFDLFGETVPEIVACYKKGYRHHYANLLREIVEFRSEHPEDLDNAFIPFSRGFRPEGRGYTTASFLDEVQRVLNENPLVAKRR